MTNYNIGNVIPNALSNFFHKLNEIKSRDGFCLLGNLQGHSNLRERNLILNA